MSGLSDSEKIAHKIAKLINDLTIDLDQIGTYIARYSNTTYRRFLEIADAAKWEKEDDDNTIGY